jgi:hypothetical protein
MKFAPATREDDERALDLIRLRCMGITTTEAGRRYGLTGRQVGTITNRVRREDEAHSENGVGGHYW